MSDFDPLNPKPGCYRGIPADVYHSAVAASSSILKAIHCESPAHARFLIEEPDGKTSRAMEFGDSCHAALLEPRRFDVEYVVAEQCAAFTSKGNEQCSRTGVRVIEVESGPRWFCEQHAKVLRSLREVTPANVVTARERDRLAAIRTAVWQDPAARELMSRATAVELTLIWEDPATGVRCKARPDLLIEREGAPILADLKTTASAKPERFAAQAAKLGYDLQVAHYLNGLRHCGFGENGSAWVIAVESDAPHVISVFEADDYNFVQPGRDHAAAAIQTYFECMTTGVWPGYAQPGQPLTLVLPDWILRKLAQEQFEGSLL